MKEVTDPALLAQLNADSAPQHSGVEVTDPALLAQLNATDQPGLVHRAWDALAIPEQKSKEGLRMLADMVPQPEPTGNLPADIVKGAPRILTDSLAETAPGFISRGAIVTAGALKAGQLGAPLAEAAGRQLAKGAEAISGLEYKNPGILKDAFNDRKVLMGPTSDKVGAMYEGMTNPDQIRKSFARSTDSKALVDEAMQAVDDGSLTSAEALVARRTLDKIKKSLPDYSYRQMRDSFDGIAKTISADADAAFSQAKKTDALRNFFPQNKLGGTSIAKSFLGTLAGVFPTLAMSPAIQGATATGLGEVSSKILAPLMSASIRTGGATGALAELLAMARQNTR